MINTVRMCNSSVLGKHLREEIIRILPDGDKNEGDERKRAARVRALLARLAGTRQKFFLALGHPTLRLRGREVTALQSAINDTDKILDIHAIRGIGRKCKCASFAFSVARSRRNHLLRNYYEL